MNFINRLIGQFGLLIYQFQVSLYSGGVLFFTHHFFEIILFNDLIITLVPFYCIIHTHMFWFKRFSFSVFMRIANVLLSRTMAMSFLKAQLISLSISYRKLFPCTPLLTSGCGLQYLLFLWKLFRQHCIRWKNTINKLL